MGEYSQMQNRRQQLKGLLKDLESSLRLGKGPKSPTNDLKESGSNLAKPQNFLNLNSKMYPDENPMNFLVKAHTQTGSIPKGSNRILNRITKRDYLEALMSHLPPELRKQKPQESSDE
jgi:hypothetical protein